MKLMKRLIVIFFIFALIGYYASIADSADFPTKPINVYVGMAPGGATDVAVRVIVAETNKHLEHPLVVVNKPGGGGAIATDLVAKSKPDGYNLNWTTLGTVIQTIVDPNNPFKMKDLTPIARAYQMAMVIGVKSDSGFKTLGDLVKTAKEKPGTIPAGTPGVKSIWHFGMEIFSKEAGMKLRHLPLKSDAEIITNVLGGHVDVGFIGAGAVGGHIKAGTLRGLAITSGQRASGLPQVPTLSEQGYPKAGVVTWGAVQGPAGLPGDVVEKIGAAFEKALKSPQVTKALETQGLDPWFMGPKDLNAFVAAEERRMLEAAQGAQLIGR
jgi:tripartite-type tricarboxylate transporter receptor subunit TctC